MKILVFGASGSGTTTLAKAISQKTGFVHLDADDYYWKKTWPPFQEKIPLSDRNEKLRSDCEINEHVVLSGSMVSWGKEWEAAFDLAIFIRLENSIRMERLKKREIDRYGKELQFNLIIQQNSKAFWNGQISMKIRLLKGEA